VGDLIARYSRYVAIDDSKTPAGDPILHPFEDTPIDEYVCLALYTASRAITATYRELLAALDLTYPQYLVMRLLWQRGAMPVKEIGAVLSLDYGTLSPMLKRLEARDLIHRVRRAQDERSVEIQLSAAGEAMREEARQVPNELVCAMGFDERELTELRTTLQRLTRGLAAGG
jgi:DNA-binding MarR family transcriptional regulator